MADAEDKVYTGACYCSAVTYEAKGLTDIWYCHCVQCRKLTGQYMAAAGVARENFSVQGDIRWIRVSKKAEHGFCAECCSPLFWRHSDQPTLSIIASNLHDTSGLTVKGHIFVAEKGDYYEITDSLPQFDAYPVDGTR